MPSLKIFILSGLISLGLGLDTIFADTNETLLKLGRALYFDVNLSLNRTQSCATCHSPDKGFSDHRGKGVEAAASLGDDGKSLGDRNAPTASYAALTPEFHLKKSGIYAGGQFLDGRASSLEDQAGGPPLNPIEMGMPDKKAVVDRIRENSVYVDMFKSVFGRKIFKDADAAYSAMTQAIAEFERNPFFSPFDSKYDLHLKGEYTLTEQEELGKTLFFSEQFTNCNQCHQLKHTPGAEGETFSNYEYHNIGVPANTGLRAINGVADDFIDTGLFANPAIDDERQKGKFKTPTLRNVAVTGPYMHNGVFKDLRTVVLFYNKFNSRSEKRRINPETGQQWRPPEIEENISLKELEIGPALNDKRIDALVAFMRLLTDQKFEYLLEPGRGQQSAVK